MNRLYGGNYGRAQVDPEFCAAQKLVGDLERKYNVLKPQIEEFERAVGNVDPGDRAVGLLRMQLDLLRPELEQVKSAMLEAQRARDELLKKNSEED